MWPLAWHECAVPWAECEWTSFIQECHWTQPQVTGPSSPATLNLWSALTSQQSVEALRPERKPKASQHRIWAIDITSPSGWRQPCQSSRKSTHSSSPLLLPVPEFLLHLETVFPCLALHHMLVEYFFFSHLKCIFFKKNFHWSIVDLQCCVRFGCTAKWFSYTYTYIHSFLDSFPI